MLNAGPSAVGCFKRGIYHPRGRVWASPHRLRPSTGRLRPVGGDLSIARGGAAPGFQSLI